MPALHMCHADAYIILNICSDLGVHIDGFMALVAHTAVLGAGAAAPVVGPAADVIAAAHQAAEVALRLIKPGTKNTAVTAAIEEVATAYGVNPILSMQCQQVKQWQIEGEKTIPLKNAPELAKYNEHEFKLGEVYAVDIAMSSGEGKPREGLARTTVYKKVLEVQYTCRMGASQKLMHEVNKRFPALPFTLRAFAEENSARLGITEPAKHQAVAGYPVLYEKEGSAVAHVRFTAILLPAGTFKATGLEMPEYVKTQKSCKYTGLASCLNDAKSAQPCPASPHHSHLPPSLSFPFPLQCPLPWPPCVHSPRMSSPQREARRTLTEMPPCPLKHGTT